MYIFFLVEPKDKIKLTPDMISKVKYLETNSVAKGTIKDYGQDAKNVFQKLISSKTVVSKTTFWKKSFPKTLLIFLNVLLNFH